MLADTIFALSAKCSFGSQNLSSSSKNMLVWHGQALAVRAPWRSSRGSWLLDFSDFRLQRFFLTSIFHIFVILVAARSLTTVLYPCSECLKRYCCTNFTCNLWWLTCFRWSHRTVSSCCEMFLMHKNSFFVRPNCYAASSPTQSCVVRDLNP